MYMRRLLTCWHQPACDSGSSISSVVGLETDRTAFVYFFSKVIVVDESKIDIISKLSK